MIHKPYFTVCIFTCAFVSFLYTVVCVDAGGGYIRCTNTHTPWLSKRLSWILNDPTAGGEIVCGVIIAGAAKTFKNNDCL